MRLFSVQLMRTAVPAGTDPGTTSGYTDLGLTDSGATARSR